MLPFYLCVCWGYSIFATVGSVVVSNQPIAGSIIVRHMELILVLSLPLRVYYLMRCTYITLHEVIMISFDSTWPSLAGSLVFGKIRKIWRYWVVCAYLFSTSLIFVVSLRLEWLGCWRYSGTKWLPCPVEMLGWLSFIFILHYIISSTMSLTTLILCQIVLKYMN